MKRYLFIMVLLCVTMAGFANRKNIDFDDQQRSLMPLIEAYIDGRMLELEIAEDLGTLDIVIEDVSGNVVFSSAIDGNNGVIPLELEKGNYNLIITSKEYILLGNFSVEE